MPLYEYRCPRCCQHWELTLPMEHAMPSCPECRTFVDGEVMPVYLVRQWVRPPQVPPSRVQS